MPNSQLLVFYSAQRHTELHGYATNWNSTGYFDVFYPVRKYSINVLSMRAIIHKVNVTINYQNSFCKRRIFW